MRLPLNIPVKKSLHAGTFTSDLVKWVVLLLCQGENVYDLVEQDLGRNCNNILTH